MKLVVKQSIVVVGDETGEYPRELVLPGEYEIGVFMREETPWFFLEDTKSGIPAIECWRLEGEGRVKIIIFWEDFANIWEPFIRERYVK